MIAISYIVLLKMFPNKQLKFAASKDVIHKELEKLGPMSGKEKMVLTIFGVTVFLWIFRTVYNKWLPVLIHKIEVVLLKVAPIPIEEIPSLGINDTIISIFAAIALFVIPYNLKKGDFIIEWKDTSKLAWGILILFGGGLALAKGMSVSGIVDLVANAIAASCRRVCSANSEANSIGVSGSTTQNSSPP